MKLYWTLFSFFKKIFVCVRVRLGRPEEDVLFFEAGVPGACELSNG